MVDVNVTLLVNFLSLYIMQSWPAHREVCVCTCVRARECRCADVCVCMYVWGHVKRDSDIKALSHNYHKAVT